MLLFKTTSPRQTFNLGYALGKKLIPGAVICLIGPLGSGKTLFVQGIVSGLKVKPKAVSPSFKLINQYTGHIPVYHFDLYRLKGIRDLENLGYEEYFYGQGVTVIEWAEKIKSYWPKEHLEVYFYYFNDNKRKIKLVPYGKDYQKLLSFLEQNENFRN